MITTDASPTQGEKWLAAGAVAVFMTMVFRNGWVTEDAYLTLRTIDNWVNGYGLRWNVDERVQAYTHPLWMLLLTPAFLIIRHPYWAALTVSIVMTCAATVALMRLSRSSGHAVTAISLMALSRSVIDYSTSGLENPLSHLLLAVLVWLYAVRGARVLWLALCTALLALNRMDALLIAFLPLVHVTILSYRERGPKQTAKELALGFSPYLAWELFSLIYYGFLVPNTAFAKLNTGLARGEVVQQGVIYVAHTIMWDPVLLAIILIGLTFCAVKRELRTTVLALSLLLHIVYVMQIGGDFMKGRFLTIPVYLACCLVAISSLPLQELSRVATILLPTLVLFLHPSATDLHVAYTGEEDEREFYENHLGIMSFTRGGQVPHHIFRDEGEQMAAAASIQPVRTSINVGIMGYFAGPKVHIVDTLALADPLLARLPSRYDPGWRIGHYARGVPPGYVETLRAGGQCRMPDPRLCEYWDHLHEIISGDVWSWHRFKTIAVMNVGGYQSLIDEDRYRYPDVQQVSVNALREPIAEGAQWNDPNARRIPIDGMNIVLDGLSHSATLEASVDSNDTYEFTFKHGSQAATLRSSPTGERMRTRVLEVPPTAAQNGYDSILVRPVRGDGMYSIGYVRIKP